MLFQRFTAIGWYLLPLHLAMRDGLPGVGPHSQFLIYKLPKYHRMYVGTTYTWSIPRFWNWLQPPQGSVQLLMIQKNSTPKLWKSASGTKDYGHLADPQVWIHGAVQIFFSLGIGHLPFSCFRGSYQVPFLMDTLGFCSWQFLGGLVMGTRKKNWRKNAMLLEWFRHV